MITPPDMLTNKIGRSGIETSLVLLVLLLVGCSPSGPRALLDGSRLLGKGQPGAATVRLEEAVQQMPTNGLAWAYLAVARHQSGSLSNAEPAYREAIQLNPELAECRFGLGTLYWQQGQWAEAREQFAAVTVMRPEYGLAWLRLGECQFRMADVRGAQASLLRAVTLDGQSADNWNWLGLVQVQVGQWKDAEASFQKALDQQMNHAPALLNLAVLRHQRLNHPRDALDLYRQYLAYWPSAANADQVRRVAAQLEQQLTPPAPPPALPAAVPVEPAPKVVALKPSPPAPSAVTLRPVALPPPPKQPPPAERQPATPTSAPPDLVAAVAPSNGVITSTVASASVITNKPSTELGAKVPPPPRKRSLLSKLNPVNLFKGKADDVKVTPLPQDSSGSAKSSAVASATLALPAQPEPFNPPGATRFPRYTYRVGSVFVSGDKAAAERMCREAEKLRLGGRLEEAGERSLAAIRENPASYEAHFNLGLVALQSGNLPQAVAAFEAATLLDPDSDAARYNFGLALKQAGFPVDAAEQMQHLLQRDPNDVRAHLMLGNLCVRPFGDKVLARSHYQRVLEIAPSHPEAGSIRFWLKANSS